MNLPSYEERQAVEMFEMVTRLLALAGMTEATRQVCDWLAEVAERSSDPERRQYLAMERLLRHADFLGGAPDKQAIVVCRADKVDGQPGPYELATRQVFTQDGAYRYAAGISASREPIVVTGLFDELRRAK